MSRETTFASLKKNPDIPVLIIGAGINGIGTFRDLALNGVDVLLVERGDFCSGASAASSRMAHGGIRYLENGEFRLVREAVHERNRMIRNAPHLVRPLPTTIPMFKRLSGLLNAPLKFLGLLDKPSERGTVIIKLGLMMYDLFTGKARTVPAHVFRGRGRSLELWPALNSKVVASATYYDGAILNPERLALEILLDGESDTPEARALNYTSVVAGTVDTVTVRDELTGTEYLVRPKLVINAAGPWIDNVNALLGQKTKFIGGTKGSHLVLDNPELRAAIGNNEFFFENKDGRIVLIYPLYERVLIGTSDLAADDPDMVRCTDEEIGYFLDMVSHVFPEIKVSRDQIVFHYCGIRPLEHSGARTTGQISRDHTVRVQESAETGLAYPIHSLIGGKWTSYRAFSEEATDRALAILGRKRVKNTRELAIGGGRDFPHDETGLQKYVEGLAAASGLAVARVAELCARYGSRAADFCKHLNSKGENLLKTLPGFSFEEITFLAQREKIVHLDDLLLRRTMMATLGQLTPAAVDETCEALAAALNWSGELRQQELARARKLLSQNHGVSL